MSNAAGDPRDMNNKLINPNPPKKKTKKAPKPRPATGTTTVTSPGRAGAGTGGGSSVGGGGGSNSPAPARTGAGSGSGGAAARGGSTSSTTASGSTGAPQEYKPFDVLPYYTPALDQLRKQRAASDATRQAQLANLDKLNEWFAKQSGQGQADIQARLNQTQAATAGLNEATRDKTGDYLSKAMASVQGNAELMQSAGVTAAQQANTASSAIPAAAELYNQQQAVAMTKRQADENGIYAARAANLQSQANANHLQRSMALDQTETGLRTEMGKADLAERQRVQQLNESAASAYRQWQVDKQLSDFTQGIKTAQVEIDRFKAETGRMTAENDAMAKNVANNLNQKKLNLAERQQALREWTAKQNVTEKEKDRLLKVGLANLKASGGGAGGNPSSVASKYINGIKNTYGAPLGQLNRHQYGQAANGLLNQLAAANPNMSRVQAMRVLRSYFDSSVTNDRRIIALARTLFKTA